MNVQLSVERRVVLRPWSVHTCREEVSVDLIPHEILAQQRASTHTILKVYFCVTPTQECICL